MTPVTGYFTDFLSNIRLSENQVNDLKTGHTTLVERLYADQGLKDLILKTFLQGSYKRSTAIKPRDEQRADVDVVVVTNIDPKQYSPASVIKLFEPFLEKHYKGKYKINGRSIGIELSYVDLDLVITSDPNEIDSSTLKNKAIFADESIEDTAQDLFKNNDQWKLFPLLIPDRDAREWTPTHPQEQIRWTINKNAQCNGHYINVVKAIKWWRRINKDNLPKYPKGYPLEHIVGYCCPDGITSVAEGITLSMEGIISNFEQYAQNKTTPSLPDHGVPEHYVLKRISGEDFSKFYEQLKSASIIASKALKETDVEKSVNLWREIFGSEFGPYIGGSKSSSSTPITGGYIPPSAPSNPGPTQRFG